jgi:hypothetical protein
VPFATAEISFLEIPLYETHEIFALRIWEASAFAVIPFPSGTIPINEKTSTQASNIETAFPALFLNIKRPP